MAKDIDTLIKNSSLIEARARFAGEQIGVGELPGFEYAQREFNRLLVAYGDGEQILKADANPRETLQNIKELAILSGQLNDGFLTKNDEWQRSRRTGLENAGKTGLREIPADFFVGVEKLNADPQAIKDKVSQVANALNTRGQQIFDRGGSMTDSFGNVLTAKRKLERQTLNIHDSIDRAVSFTTEKYAPEYALLKEEAAGRIKLYEQAVELGQKPEDKHLGQGHDLMEKYKADILQREKDKQEAQAKAEQEAADKLKAEEAAKKADEEAKLAAQAEAKAAKDAQDTPEKLMEDFEKLGAGPMPQELRGTKAGEELEALRHKAARHLFEYARDPDKGTHVFTHPEQGNAHHTVDKIGKVLKEQLGEHAATRAHEVAANNLAKDVNAVFTKHGLPTVNVEKKTGRDFSL